MTTAAKKRILVIDNEPASTRMARLTLERHDGFEVRRRNDPIRALTAAGLFRPDLILLLRPAGSCINRPAPHCTLPPQASLPSPE